MPFNSSRHARDAGVDRATRVSGVALAIALGLAAARWACRCSTRPDARDFVRSAAFRSGPQLESTER